MSIVLHDVDRLQLLAQLLSPEDIRFLAPYPGIQKKFQKNRARIFRMELRALAADSAQAYRSRLNRIKNSGQWQVYPALLMLTGATCYSLTALFLAGVLTQWRVPVRVDIPSHSTRVFRYLSAEPLFAAPPN